MTMPDVVAKIKGSVSSDVSRSRALVVRLCEGGRCLRRRAHTSPTITSRARVAAKRVRSSVRPAAGLDCLLASDDLEVESRLASGLGCTVRGDWSSCMLNHAEIAVENHLDSLVIQYQRDVR